MSSVTGREFLDATLTPLLPGKWKIIPYESNLDAIAIPTVMYRIRSLTKFPQAPASSFLGTWVLTVIVPETDPALRDDAADDAVMTVLEALTAARIKWDVAEKAAWGSQYVCYDITTQLRTAR